MLRTHADALLSDVRYGFRSMARTPGFTAVALVMIALGTGANAAMFSIVDSIMLRSPFTDPDRLAIVLVAQPGGEGANAVSLYGERRSTTCDASSAAAALISAGRRGFAGFGVRMMTLRNGPALCANGTYSSGRELRLLPRVRVSPITPTTCRTILASPRCTSIVAPTGFPRGHARRTSALGLGLATASTRLLQSWLYGVTPLDPATFAWSAAGMLGIAALASYLPARRAARIDPLVTLRAE